MILTEDTAELLVLAARAQLLATQLRKIALKFPLAIQESLLSVTEQVARADVTIRSLARLA